MTGIDQALERLLVVKSQMGDRLALEELFLLHHRQLQYYVRRILESQDAAGDVVQETWLTVIRQVRRLRSPEAFVTWLYRIARSKAFGLLKAEGRSEPLLAMETVADENDDFSPADAARVHQGLRTLSRQHREVLVLRFMEDLSYESMAAVIRCSVGTVRSRLHYAKGRLRKELEKDYG